MAIGAGKLGGVIVGSLGMPMQIGAGAALLGGSALGALGNILGGGGDQTVTQQNQISQEQQRLLNKAQRRAQLQEQLGISRRGQKQASRQLEGLLRGKISPEFQKLIQSTFQQTAAPILSQASATGNFGGSDFNQLLGGISGDVASQLFQQAVGAARGQGQQGFQNLLGIAGLQGGGTTQTTTPLSGGNPLLGALGGASTGLGLLGQFNALQQPQEFAGPGF